MINGTVGLAPSRTEKGDAPGRQNGFPICFHIGYTDSGRETEKIPQGPDNTGFSSANLFAFKKGVAAGAPSLH